jgi:hypothetical protein
MRSRNKDGGLDKTRAWASKKLILGSPFHLFMPYGSLSKTSSGASYLVRRAKYGKQPHYYSYSSAQAVLSFYREDLIL